MVIDFLLSVFFVLKMVILRLFVLVLCRKVNVVVRFEILLLMMVMFVCVFKFLGCVYVV